MKPFFSALILTISLGLSLPATAASVPLPRPETWAVPLALPGVSNLYRVSDNVYRSQQPTPEGLGLLHARLGIRTVINLRMFHDDAELATPPGLRLLRVPVNTWQIEDIDVVRVLRILRRRENGPFLIHCLHGADRTGVMSAMYRIVEQGWTREQALRELQEGGYGFHPVWFNIVRYLEHVDIGRIRAQVDSPEPPVMPDPVFPES